MDRIVISKIQGVTYAYVRDICDVAQGNVTRRLSPRQDDPGRQAAVAVNDVLDMHHPRPKQDKADQTVLHGGILKPSGA